MPPPCPPKASWDDLSGSRDIGAGRGAAITSTGSAAGAVDCAAWSMGAGDSVAAVGVLGLMSCWDGVGRYL
jgi:hypothetical protein